MFLAVGSANAWNCPSGQRRVQAPAGTPTNTPNYDVVEGIAFICEPTTPPTTPPATPTTQNQSQTQSQNQNASSNSASNASSNSNATAKGGNSTSNSNSQGGSATGGSVSGSGNSQNTLKNSGNSSNANTNTVSANGGAGGAGGNQSQSSVSGASNNGNGANNSTYESNTVVKAAAATAFAQASPTVSCFKGVGVGGQLVGGGISFSGGKIDGNCAVLETARSFANFGSDVAYCKTMLTNKYVLKAGVTFEDCMLTRKLPVPVQVERLPEPVPTFVPIIVPAPTPESNPVVTVKTEQSFVTSCRLQNNVIGNQCKRFLDDAVLRLRGNPTSTLRLSGPVEAGGAVTYLKGKIDPSRISQPVFSDEQNNTLTLTLVWVN